MASKSTQIYKSLLTGATVVHKPVLKHAEETVNNSENTTVPVNESLLNVILLSDEHKDIKRETDEEQQISTETNCAESSEESRSYNNSKSIQATNKQLKPQSKFGNGNFSLNEIYNAARLEDDHGQKKVIATLWHPPNAADINNGSINSDTMYSDSSDEISDIDDKRCETPESDCSNTSNLSLKDLTNEDPKRNSTLCKIIKPQGTWYPPGVTDAEANIVSHHQRVSGHVHSDKKGKKGFSEMETSHEKNTSSNQDHNKDITNFMYSKDSKVYDALRKKCTVDCETGLLNKDNKNKCKKIFLETLVAKIKKEPVRKCHSVNDDVSEGAHLKRAISETVNKEIGPTPKRSRRKASKVEKVNVGDQDYDDFDMDEYFTYNNDTKNDQENTSHKEIVVQCPSGLKTAILDLKSSTVKPSVHIGSVESLLTGTNNHINVNPLSVLNDVHTAKDLITPRVNPYQRLLPVSHKQKVKNALQVDLEKTRPYLKSLLTGEIIQGKNSSVQPAIGSTPGNSSRVHVSSDSTLQRDKHKSDDLVMEGDIPSNYRTDNFEKEFCIFARKWKHGYRADKFDCIKAASNVKEKKSVSPKMEKKSKLEKGVNAQKDHVNDNANSKDLLLAHLVNRVSNDQGGDVFFRPSNLPVKNPGNKHSFDAMMLTPNFRKDNAKKFGPPKDWKVPNPYEYHVNPTGLSGGSVQTKDNTGMDLTLSSGSFPLNKWQQCSYTSSDSKFTDESPMQALDLTMKKTAVKSHKKCLDLRKKCDNSDERDGEVPIENSEVVQTKKNMHERESSSRGKHAEPILNVPVLPWLSKRKENEEPSHKGGIPENAERAIDVKNIKNKSDTNGNRERLINGKDPQNLEDYKCKQKHHKLGLNGTNDASVKKLKNSKKQNIKHNTGATVKETPGDALTPVGVIYNSLLTGKKFVAWDMPNKSQCGLPPREGEMVARPDGGKLMLFELGNKSTEQSKVKDVPYKNLK